MAAYHKKMNAKGVNISGGLKRPCHFSAGNRRGNTRVSNKFRGGITHRHPRPRACSGVGDRMKRSAPPRTDSKLATTTSRQPQALFKQSSARPSNFLDRIKLPQLNDGADSGSRIPKINHKQKVILAEPSTLRFGVSSVRGKRNYMEDEYKIVENMVGTQDSSLTVGSNGAVDAASKANEANCVSPTLFFGVFDGHAGKRCSSRISRSIPLLLSRHPSFHFDLSRALVETYMLADEKFLAWANRRNCQDGSTACTVSRRGDILYICNTGDSRAIVCRKGIAIELSHDHKPSNLKERKRIYKSGGTVQTVMGVPRVNGVLSVARAFGDAPLKGKGLCVDPDIIQHEINPGDEFVVVGSDGLYDVLTNQEIAEFVSERLTSSPEGKLSAVAKKLTTRAIRRGSLDNITAVIVLLQDKVPPSTVKESRDDDVEVELRVKTADCSKQRVPLFAYSPISKHTDSMSKLDGNNVVGDLKKTPLTEAGPKKIVPSAPISRNSVPRDVGSLIFRSFLKRTESDPLSFPLNMVKFRLDKVASHPSLTSAADSAAQKTTTAKGTTPKGPNIARFLSTPTSSELKKNRNLSLTSMRKAKLQKPLNYHSRRNVKPATPRMRLPEKESGSAAAATANKSQRR